MLPYSDAVLCYHTKISMVVEERRSDHWYSASLACSETGLKKAAGNKSKLAPLATLPGKNGNPTFAAVAAGYDKSPGELRQTFPLEPGERRRAGGLSLTCSVFPGGSGPPKAGTAKAEAPGKPPVPRLTSVESDASDRWVSVLAQ